MKELLVWGQGYTSLSSNFHHPCLFNHSFAPAARFDLAIDSHSSTTSLDNSITGGSPLNPSSIPVLTDGPSLSDLIREFQPIAQLDLNSFHSSLPSLPLCPQCEPLCARCASQFSCSSCSSGLLIDGLCFHEEVSPLSGVANQTLFSFDPYDFDRLSLYAQRELRLAPLPEPVTFESAFLSYPDGSSSTIDDVSAFSVQVFPLIGATAFNVSFFAVYSIQGVLR